MESIHSLTSLLTARSIATRDVSGESKPQQRLADFERFVSPTATADSLPSLIDSTGAIFLPAVAKFHPALSQPAVSFLTVFRAATRMAGLCSGVAQGCDYVGRTRTPTEEKQRLDVCEEEVRQELDAIQQDRRRVDGAIAALQGTGSEEPTKRKAGKEKAKRTLAAAGKLEVTKYMEMILHEESPVEEQKLKARVEELAQQDGYSRLGIGLRVKQALVGLRFVRTVEGIKLSPVTEDARSQAG
jgi:hypothetical protein